MDSTPPLQIPSENAPIGTTEKDEPSAALVKPAGADLTLPSTNQAETPLPASVERKGLRFLKSQVEDAFGRVTYSHKMREKSGDRQAKKLARLRALQIGGALITMVGAILAIFAIPQGTRVAAAVFAAISFISSLFKNDTDQLAQTRASASKLWAIREQYQSFLVDLEAGTLTLAEARRRRDELQAKTAAVYEKYPLSDDDAYAKAKQQIKSGEASFTEDELEDMKAPGMRKTSNGNGAANR